MVKVDLPPEAIPPGTFCQDPATGRIYVRMPSDAAEACPIWADSDPTSADAAS